MNNENNNQEFNGSAFPKIEISGIHQAENSIPVVPEQNIAQQPSYMNQQVVPEQSMAQQPSYMNQQQSNFVVPQNNISNNNQGVYTMDNRGPSGEPGKEPFYLNKTKLGIASFFAALLIIAAYFGINYLIDSMNVDKLKYNETYISKEDGTTLFIVFKEDGTCLVDEFGIIDCKYEIEFSNILVDFSFATLRKEWIFRVSGEDSITLHKEVYYEDGEIKMGSGKRVFTIDDDITPVTTTKKTTTKKGATTTTTRYIPTTTTRTTVFNNTIRAVANISNYSSSKHYAPMFFITNGNLYAHYERDNSDELIIDTGDVISMLYIMDSDKDDSYFIFVKRDGSIYYLNNYIMSDYSKYELVLIEGAKYVDRGYTVDGYLYLYGEDGTLYSRIKIDKKL